MNDDEFSKLIDDKLASGEWTIDANNNNIIKREKVMSNTLIDSEVTQDSPKITTEDLTSKAGLVNHLLKSYGNISSLIVILDLLFKGKNESKLYSYIKRGISIGVFGYDMYNKIKDYYKEKNSTVSDDKSEKIATILEKRTAWTYNIDLFPFSHEVIKWLLKSPKTDNIKIIKYYQLASNKSFSYLEDLDGMKEISILIEYQDIKVVLVCEVFTLLGETTARILELYGYDIECRWREEFVLEVQRDYLTTLNLQDNILYYDYQISTRKRTSDIDFDFCTLNFPKFKKEISSTLDHGLRRGYILVGNPGTGKTSILMRLENELRKYPFIYVTPSNIDNENKIKSLFTFIRTLEPCVVVFEDMDCYELGDKNKKTGVLLNYIDDADLNCVFIATINDSCKLNYSICRPGRFDEVKEICEPSDNENIYKIMNTHYVRQTKCIKFYENKLFIKDIPVDMYDKMKEHNLTQAQYCELVQKAIIQNKEITVESLSESLVDLIKSKESLEKYKNGICK